jgi:hypothetical protein
MANEIYETIFPKLNGDDDFAMSTKLQNGKMHYYHSFNVPIF